MKRFIPRGCCAAALLACALVGGAPASASAGEPFAYPRDATAPAFGARTVDGDVATTELSYRSGGARVAGSLVAPATAVQAAPGIVWVHWLGEPETTNRSEFLADARALAQRGAVSLAIDAMWSRVDWFERGGRPADDERDLIAQVVAIRRAIDVLLATRNVDPQRIALVGHDFGAMYGALAVAVDPRVRWVVLMTPAPTFWEWFLFGPPPADVAAYVGRMSAYDLPRWLPRARASGWLLQFADRDIYLARTTAATLRAAVPAADRTVQRYDADHALALPRATDDRRAWLVQRLFPS